MPAHERRSWCVAAALVAGVLLSSCGQSVETDASTTNLSAAEIQPVQGTDLARVTLTDRAVERLGIRTTPLVEEQVPAKPRGQSREVKRKVIPYAAVLYDPDGKAWAFTNTGGRSYVREPIEVDYVEGDRAVLADGPAVGTAIVRQGAAELYGAELGVDVE
ncbi:MAG: hypothetical protein ACRDPK_20995 [Carbonactinosporaceae bacterium]